MLKSWRFLTLATLCFFFPPYPFLYLVIIQGVHVADNLHQILWVNVAHPFLCLERWEIVTVQANRELSEKCINKPKLGERFGNFHLSTVQMCEVFLFFY